jgi:hypothetical protein
VAKLDPSGRVLWRRVYNSGEEDVHACVVADRTGHIFVGVTSVNDTATHTHLLEYSPAGGLLGDRALAGASNASCLALAIDSADAILGVGAAGPDGAQHYLGWRYFRGKFSVFLTGQDYSHGLNDLANDVAIDSTGNVVITGVSNPGADADVVTVKLALPQH